MAQAVFIHEGLSIDHTPGGDLAAGEVVVQGDLVGVAKKPIAANEPGSLTITGVFDVAKEGGVGVTFTTGAPVYWDNANKFAVATDGAGANKRMGKAVQSAADNDSTVRVRLIP